MEIVWGSALGDRDARDYAALVEEARGAHYAQTIAWASVAVAGRRRHARFFLARRGGRAIGAAVVLRPRAWGPLLAPIAIVERGPVCADPSDLEIVVRALAREARRHGVARISVMPYWAGDDAVVAEAALARAGFRDVQARDGAHARTVRVDVGGRSDAEILAGPERKKLRYELRNAEREGIVVRRSNSARDFAILARLDEALARSQGRRPRARAWFDAAGAYLREDERRGALFVCEPSGASGEAISAALVLAHAKLALYVAGASQIGPRSFSKMASPLFAAAQWARDVGAEALDLGGVPLEGDDDPKRVAIAQFKRDFSKTNVRLVGEHARWF